MHESRLKRRKRRLEARRVVASAPQRIAIDAEGEVLEVLEHVGKPPVPFPGWDVEVWQGVIGGHDGAVPLDGGVHEEGLFPRGKRVR